MRKPFCLCLGLTLLLLAPTLRAQTADTPLYTVDAIRYATIPGFPLSGLVAGADRSQKISSKSAKTSKPARAVTFNCLDRLVRRVKNPGTPLQIPKEKLCAYVPEF